MAFLDKLNYVEILSVGISGFGFLLILLAFLLIVREQNRNSEPRKGIISTIRFFMGINVLNIVVVGFLGLPAITNNVSLKSDVAQLKHDNEIKETKISVLGASKKLDELESMPVVRTSATLAVQNYVHSLDSLKIEGSTYDSAQIIGAEIMRDLNILEHTPQKDTIRIQRTFQKIMRNKEKADKMILRDQINHPQ